MNNLKYTLRCFVCVLLLWASLASAFSEALIAAAKAIAKGDASNEQQALILTNYKTFNLMGLGGYRRKGISDEVYQANQKFFAEINNEIAQETLDYMNMDGTIPGVKRRYNAGTDTDINVYFKGEGKDKRKLRVKDIQNTRDYYNTKYRERIRKLNPKLDVDNVNFSADNETDFMPDASVDPATGKMINIDDREFVRAARFVNKEGGLMYTNPMAVRVEINKNKKGYVIQLEGSKAYSNEMLENIELKNQKMNRHRAKLRVLQNQRKHTKTPEARKILEAEINKSMAEIQLDQSQMAKYMDRLDDLNAKMREQHLLPPPEKAKGIHMLAGQVSGNRGPDTIDEAAAIAKYKDRIQKKSMQNLSATYAQLAANEGDPKKRSEFIQQAAKINFEHLNADEQKTMVTNIQAKYGKNSPIAKELKFEVHKAKVQKAMDSIVGLQKVEALAGKVNDVFGKYDKAVGIYNDYKKGGVWLVIKNESESFLKDQLKERLTGKITANLTKRAMAAFPVLGPISALHGAYSTAHDLTRNVMTHVKVNGKTLDEHTQEGIDNNFYVSAVDKQERNNNLTKMLTKAIEKKKLRLPKGMTIQEAQKKVLENADKGGSLFSFLEGGTKRPKPKTKPKTLDDIKPEEFESINTVDSERDKELTRQLMELLKGGRFILPEGMTKAQARKLVLLNSKAGKDKFGFLIDREKRLKAQQAALDKWKAEINPQKDYNLLSFRAPGYKRITKALRNRDNGLMIRATAHFVIDKIDAWPEGGVVLYRDGEAVAQVAAQSIGRAYATRTEDPMNKFKWLLDIRVELTDPLKGLDQQLEPPAVHYYRMIWHLFDDKGQPKSALGSTEQSITYASFPTSPGGQPTLLICDDEGKPEEDSDRSNLLLEHLSMHYYGLSYRAKPTRFGDANLHYVELPDPLYSHYRRINETEREIKYYSQGKRLGTRLFDEAGTLIEQSFRPSGPGQYQGLRLNRYKSGLTGIINVTENWYDERGRKHGPYRDNIDGVLRSDFYYKDGVQHGEQIRRNKDGELMFIKHYDMGKLDGLFETYHSNGKLYIKTYYKQDVDVGPREEYFDDGTKKLFAEFAIKDGKVVRHGKHQEWNSFGHPTVDESFHMGVHHGHCRFFYRGVQDASLLRRETHYESGAKHGLEINYHDAYNRDTTVQSKIFYKKGKKDGIAEYYHYNGEAHYSVFYRNDQEINTIKSWQRYPDGASKNKINRLVTENTLSSDGMLVSSINKQYSTKDGHFMGTKTAGYARSVQPPAQAGYEVIRGTKLSSGPNKKVVKNGPELHYKGTQLVLEVAWANGVPNGTVKSWYDEGQPKTTGQYRNGKLHGRQQSFDLDGTLNYSAMYNHGLLDGELFTLTKQERPEGLLMTTKVFEIQNGKSVETNTKTTRGVNKLDGKFISHGPHVVIKGGKTLFSGNYRDGIKHGEFFEIRDDQYKETITYSMGQQHGFYRLTDPQDRLRKEANYQDGLIKKHKQWDYEGEHITYQETENKIIDGKVVEESYRTYGYYLKDGKTIYHGNMQGRYRGKPTNQVTYQDGVFHGPFIHYRDGKVTKCGTHAQGKLHLNYKQYDSQERLVGEATYNNGIKEEALSIWYEDDVANSSHHTFLTVDGRSLTHGTVTQKKDDLVLSTDEYHHGKRHGTHSKWNEAGQLIFRQQHKHGTKHGPHEEWYDDGRLKSRIVYEDGQNISNYSTYLKGDTLKGSLSNYSFVDGKRIRHGSQKQLLNDKPVVEECYDHGKKSGIWSKWTDKGVLTRQESYENDQYHGPYRRYTDKGIMQESGTYERGKRRKQVYYDRTTGSATRVMTFNPDGHKIREISYGRREGKLNKTAYAYTVVDGKSVYHGATRRFVDNQLQSEDVYDRGVVVSRMYSHERDGKRYVTQTPYAMKDGKSVSHGVVKNYCDDELTSESVYDYGIRTQRTSYSVHKDIRIKFVTPLRQFGDENLSHGVAKVYHDGKFKQESHYDKDKLTKVVVYDERDNKPLKTEFPYVEMEGKSVKHGIAKRYLDGKLIEEIEYRNGKKID